MERHIAMMLQKQNAYLRGETAILVMGLLTKRALPEEAEVWFDDLPETLVTRFLVDDMESVTTDINPMRSYQVIPSDNTDDDVSVYNLILA
eukprot:13292054-Ditylum_brightwellii.AAC.1